MKNFQVLLSYTFGFIVGSVVTQISTMAGELITAAMTVGLLIFGCFRYYRPYMRNKKNGKS